MATRVILLAECGEICIRFQHDNSGLWQRIKDDLRDNVPGAQFDSGEKSWFVDLRFRGQVLLWAERWYTLSQITDHLGARTSPPRREPKPSPVEEAYRALFLLPGAPLWAAEGVYRAAVKVAHPDVGGTHSGAVAINNAIELLRQVAS